MPAVTICIPTYEPQPAHLRAAMDSVLAQTFTDWELIVHDDASRSNVEAIVKPFLTDPRIHFYLSPTNLGIGGNWNATMKKGSASFVAYIFQDDLWHPDYLRQSMDVLQREPDVGFTAANHTYLMEGRTPGMSIGIYGEVTDLRNTQMKEGRLHHEEFLSSWITRGLRPNLIGEPSFVVLRRALMERVGPFLEDMKQGLDAEYWIRCLLVADGYWIAQNLGEFRVHPKAATAQNEESGAGSTDRLRIFQSLVKALPPGPMKTLAKKVLRREMWGMMKKFVRRKILARA